MSGSVPHRSASRRALMKAIAALPLVASRADARDYLSAVEVFAEIDRLEAFLEARLGGLAAAVPSAVPFARSVHADHDRHRRARAAWRRRLRLPLPPAAAVPGPPRGTLAEAQRVAQDLVHAHAEGLPALRDPAAVDMLARHMVDDARHLAVIQMWMETEAAG